MTEYVIVDARSKKVIIVFAFTAVALFVLGIMIGYFSGRKSGSDGDGRSSSNSMQGSICNSDNIASPEVMQYIGRYVERHSQKHACLTETSACLDHGLPRNYIAYHLNGKAINMDGKLDDDAWKEVPWSDLFVDIRSSVYPKPYLDTKFKLRWDDTNLYIGAYIQETDLWATFATHDDKLHYENNFEVFIDVDGTLFNYKQMQINVLGTMMDQVLFMSPHDADNKATYSERTWSAQVHRAVYTEGTVNNPGDTDKFWSVEMSLTFAALAGYSNRARPTPFDNEVWFMQFGRAEYKLNSTRGKYFKPQSSVPSWWSWQPCDAINLQLQDRWGLVQFRKALSDTKFSFPQWHIYKALFEVFNAMKVYAALNSKTTDRIDELDVPPYLLSGACVEIPEITLNKSDFSIAVKSKLLPHVVGTINQDRYVTFK